MILIGLALFSSTAEAGKNVVVIFADFACTEDAAGDPDDCLAVEALRRSPSVEILAVMTAGGNTHAHRAYELGTSKFPTLAVFPGSRPRSKRVTKAHLELARLISTRKTKLTFLVLSPATDFMKLVNVAPEVLDHANEVVFVAGRAAGERFRIRAGGRELRDMNFEKDRRAFVKLLPILFERKIPTTFVGFRAAMNTKVPVELMPLDFVSNAQRAWKRKCKFWFGGETPPFDLVAAMTVTRFRNLLSCQNSKVVVGRNIILENSHSSNFRMCR